MSSKHQRAANPPPISDAEIAQRAYQLWIARGCPVSDGREDWYAAEAELRAQHAVSPSSRRGIRSALRRLGL